MSTEDLGQCIKWYRHYWGLTQEEFAEQHGVDPRGLRRVENHEVKNPRSENHKKLAVYRTVGEDTMKRRDFLHRALMTSMTFAAPWQRPDILKMTAFLSSETTSLPSSMEEEIPLVETLAKAYWQLLPHQANVVDHGQLVNVQCFRLMLDSWLQTAPKNSSHFELVLRSIISEMMLIEGGLLYALNMPYEAEISYRAAVKSANGAHNPLLEAIALAWHSNFLIDTGRPDEAVAPVEAASKKAKNGGATPHVLAWIIATEADVWANQFGKYGAADKCKRALGTAANLTSSGETEQARYPVPYDYPWLFGYQGAVYAHLGNPDNGREALKALERGLEELAPTEMFRRWGLYNDLILAHSLEKNVEGACHRARQAITIAEQAKAPIYLQRTKNTIQQSLRVWKESHLVKNILEELLVAQQRFA